jgi:hypothetical protein
MQKPEDFLCWGNGSTDEILPMFSLGKSKKASLTQCGKLSKNEMPGSVRQ